jgi:hypothetical protein
MSQTQENRGDQFYVTRVPAEATAGNTDSWTAWRAPYNATVTGVRWIPDAAVTGAATNNFALALNNITTVGVVATAKTYASGTNSVANTAESYTIGAAPNVTAGDVIAWVRTVNGTGLASPAGTLEITYRFR